MKFNTCILNLFLISTSIFCSLTFAQLEEPKKDWIWFKCFRETSISFGWGTGVNEMYFKRQKKGSDLWWGLTLNSSINPLNNRFWSPIEVYKSTETGYKGEKQGTIKTGLSIVMVKQNSSNFKITAKRPPVDTLTSTHIDMFNSYDQVGSKLNDKIDIICEYRADLELQSLMKVFAGNGDDTARFAQEAHSFNNELKWKFTDYEDQKRLVELMRKK